MSTFPTLSTLLTESRADSLGLDEKKLKFLEYILVDAEVSDTFYDKKQKAKLVSLLNNAYKEYVAGATLGKVKAKLIKAGE